MKTTTDRSPPWTDAGIAKLRGILLEDALWSKWLGTAPRPSNAPT